MVAAHRSSEVFDDEHAADPRTRPENATVDSARTDDAVARIRGADKPTNVFSDTSNIIARPMEVTSTPAADGAVASIRMKRRGFREDDSRNQFPESRPTTYRRGPRFCRRLGTTDY